MIAPRLYIDGGVRVTSPEGGRRPVQRLVKQAEVLEWPRSEVLDKGQGVLERQVLDHRRPFSEQGIPGRWHTGCGYGRKLP